jgi:hypothetical protein
MDSMTPTAIVRVHRPELTTEERAKRMESIEQAAARLIIAAHEAKKERK